MKSGGVKPTDAAIWSGALSNQRTAGNTGSGGGGGQGGSGGQPFARKHEDDHVSFSELLRQRSETGSADALPADELEQLLRIIAMDNDKIRSLARNFRPLRSKAVPSLLDMPLETAVGKLEIASFRLGNVTQEFNANVPSGHVVSQVPFAGSMAVQDSGIHLTVSKGPPPKTGQKHPFLAFMQNRLGAPPQTPPGAARSHQKGSG